MKMAAEISTAISDAFLALSALHAAYKLISTSYIATLGFLVIGIAACFGVARFSQTSPTEYMVSWHKYMAWFASVAGLPLVGSAYSRMGNSALLSNILTAGCLATLILQKQLSSNVIALCGDALGGLSLVVILIVAIASSNSFGIIGVVLYIGGALVLKANMTIGGIKPADVFHYVLMIGNIGLLLGLTREQEPIYYKQI